MDEREELARLSARGHMVLPEDYVVADAVIAAGWRKIPEPGSAEWEAMVERGGGSVTGYLKPIAVDAILRAALGLDQPHREEK